jgi:hypothetical protein
MVLTSAVRLGCLLQKKIFCNSIKQVSLFSSDDVNIIVFWPFWSSCMHKCIPLLDLRFLWSKDETEAKVAWPPILIMWTTPRSDVATTRLRRLNRRFTIRFRWLCGQVHFYYNSYFRPTPFHGARSRNTSFPWALLEVKLALLNLTKRRGRIRYVTLHRLV